MPGKGCGGSRLRCGPFEIHCHLFPEALVVPDAFAMGAARPDAAEGLDLIEREPQLRDRGGQRDLVARFPCR